MFLFYFIFPAKKWYRLFCILFITRNHFIILNTTVQAQTTLSPAGLYFSIYYFFRQSLVACLYCAPFNQLLQLPPGHTSGNLIYSSNFSVIERISTLSSKRQWSSIWVAHSIKFSSLIRGRNCSLQASRDPAFSRWQIDHSICSA